MLTGGGPRRQRWLWQPGGGQGVGFVVQHIPEVPQLLLAPLRLLSGRLQVRLCGSSNCNIPKVVFIKPCRPSKT